jgi:hypothetical protein
MESFKKPIIGQEAICPDGLGRVIAYKDKFPERWIQVSTYVNDRQCKWSSGNVELLNPRGYPEEPVKAPWLDYHGNPIHDRDVIVHPDGNFGRVIFLKGRSEPGDQWVVDYGTGNLSRLCLQIGNKGKALVTLKRNIK